MAKELEGFNFEQRHGKARVRVGRVWRSKDGCRHFMVEWNVSISLLSNCVAAYVRDDNSDIVATDTMKNTVYVKAKECSEQLSAEEFAILLGKHFTSFYPQVFTAIVKIVEKPWERISVNGQPHEHGFKLGSEKHTTEAIVQKSGVLQLISGVEGLSLLKTTQMDLFGYIAKVSSNNKWLLHLNQETHSRSSYLSSKKSLFSHLNIFFSLLIFGVCEYEQSGFEGFIRDKYTALPETRERMLATEVTASWRYSYESVSSIPQKSVYFNEQYLNVKKVLVDTFFGPPERGVYSASVQSTLLQMAKAVLGRFADISSVKLKMPNIHFLPVNISSKDHGSIVKFDDDVYLPTDEPHGSIEASLSRFWSKM
ncbi:uricase-2 isoform X1 [Gossypium australe]|uniref:factor independent urate hydroxylase n=1 Tax=Gossypium australe TaxID=47621 RepID=A0A5B6V605_9ROSI|nr:uricase-2 isoform X1 [Gossypium australe]